jgi:DNA-binding response OmpR family regulator
MRILIVEDEEKLAKSLKKALEAEAYAVDVANNGEEGFEAGLVEDYDVVVLDLGLPDTDGISVCHKWREEGRKMPVIMLTARDTTKEKVLGLDSGADDYLIKPFELEELLARIRSLVRRKSGEIKNVFEIGDLSLDTGKKLVMREGKEVVLTAKEYSLLEYLMVNKDRVVSKEEILQHVWDMNTDPFTNVVDVYIGYLRSKIDKPFANKESLIKTLKGMGYKIG